MIKESIKQLVAKKDLTFNQTREIFLEILEAKASPAQIAAFLVALGIKGETYQEISGAATVIREKAVRINVKNDFLGLEQDEPVFDSCGTGGSGVNKFNISTAVAFVVAASGVKVAKHGNRAATSKTGSADVLEALGVNIAITPARTKEIIKECGIGFMFAPLYHPAFKTVVPVRKDIGIRTIFNVLGPLCNPAAATYQLLGVFQDSLRIKLAKALKELGTKRAFVINSSDLGDEVSLSGQTRVSFLDGKTIKNIILKPSDFGLKKMKISDLAASDAKTSSKIIKDILNGIKGPKRDIVLANASCCLFILGKVKTLKEGTRLAASFIDDSSAKNKLAEFKNLTNK